MTILRVFANNKKKAFVIETKKGAYEFPYSQLKVSPSRRDPLVTVQREREMAFEGFSYRLRSGKKDLVHLDHVLRYARDLDYRREEILFKLTVEARNAIKQLRIRKREVARHLKTSPSQLYRLLDPTFYGKTIDQMVKLLSALGLTVSMAVERKAAQ